MREKLLSARQAASGHILEGLFRALSAGSKLHPRARQAFKEVEITANLPYLDSNDPAHLLDVYRPVGRSETLPVVIHVHGGGFRILSKDTHWLMGLAFARKGYVVFNINYRLAPQHPFPAAIEDVCRAYEWVLDNAHRFGGDTSRLFLAGESAGGNLVTGMTLATCFERDEVFARNLYARNHRPIGTIPFCALLQASKLDRFSHKVSSLVQDRMIQIEAEYLGASDAKRYCFADPLVVLESDEPSARTLPPFFAPVGTADPILDDTRRLGRALAQRGVDCQTTYYPGEVHAFHAFVFRRNARQCWNDTFSFMDGVLQERD